jgi:adenylosuccinate lyase
MANNSTDAAAQALQAQISAMKSQSGGNPIFDTYQTSLTGRYCSNEMSQLFSQRSRHSTWRKLWLYLAEAEKELGIENISDKAIEEMRANLMVTDADFEIAKVEEKKRRHDVMAHVHAFGQVAPSAAGIIHYGVCHCPECSNACGDHQLFCRHV